MSRSSVLGPHKTILVLRVAGRCRPYLNLLVKLRIFSGFLKKIYNFMHFERVPYLKFSDQLPKTHFFFYLASSGENLILLTKIHKVTYQHAYLFNLIRAFVSHFLEPEKIASHRIAHKFVNTKVVNK